MTTEYAIGTQYLSRGKHPRLCEVVDILKTYNSKDELVHTRYVAQHGLAGQYDIERDVVAATIAIGIDALRRRA